MSVQRLTLLRRVHMKEGEKRLMASSEESRTSNRTTEETLYDFAHWRRSTWLFRRSSTLASARLEGGGKNSGGADGMSLPGSPVCEVQVASRPWVIAEAADLAGELALLD